MRRSFTQYLRLTAILTGICSTAQAAVSGSVNMQPGLKITLSRNLCSRKAWSLVGSAVFHGFFVKAGDERPVIWSRSNTRRLGAPYGSRCCGDYCASAMGTSVNPLARALDFKLDSSHSVRFCSNCFAPRSTHAWPLVSIR